MIMKKTYILSIFILFALSLGAQNESDHLDTLKMQFEEEAAQSVDDFERYSEEARIEYEKYEAQMRAEYFEYVRSIKGVWGEDSIIDDTRTEWVEYSDDYKSRSIVDFDKGSISIQIALEDIHHYDSAEIDRRISEAIEKMLDSKGSTCPYISTVDKRQTLTNRPILEGLVDFSAYSFGDTAQDEENESTKPRNARKAPPKPTTRGKELELADSNTDRDDNVATNGESMASRIAGNKEDKKSEIERRKDDARRRAKEIADGREKKGISTKKIAKSVAAQSKKTTKKVKGNDNTTRTVVEVQMRLVTDNISKSAALYKDFVAQYSQKFQIEQPLIFAVMEQESRFNPEAMSHIPAYGLMQLVPRSGGFDAYKYVYKKEWIPSKSYLFVPHQNIELGTAYLRILMNQFSRVKDPECRRLCVIAGYNTGAGNVSRAFTGNTNLGKATPLINEYSYDQLYRHLTSRLSTDEARNYVSGVSKRREKYLK